MQIKFKKTQTHKYPTGNTIYLISLLLLSLVLLFFFSLSLEDNLVVSHFSRFFLYLCILQIGCTRILSDLIWLENKKKYENCPQLQMLFKNQHFNDVLSIFSMMIFTHFFCLKEKKPYDNSGKLKCVLEKFRKQEENKNDYDEQLSLSLIWKMVIFKKIKIFQRQKKQKKNRDHDGKLSIIS